MLLFDRRIRILNDLCIFYENRIRLSISRQKQGKYLGANNDHKSIVFL